jgi:hypothetical protein
VQRKWIDTHAGKDSMTFTFNILAFSLLMCIDAWVHSSIPSHIALPLIMPGACKDMLLVTAITQREAHSWLMSGRQPLTQS